MEILRSLKTFLVIWFGQLVSLAGSQLTGFALGVWVYQESGSVTQFALISLVTVLPHVVLAPLAGALVDRWDRRWTMILGNLGAGLSTIILALLLLTGNLALWHIYLGVAAASTFSVFQGLAYMASTVLLVPKAHLGRANGLVQIAHALAQLAGPLLAGFLVTTIQIYGVMLIDGATFMLALITLAVVQIPRPAAAPTADTRLNASALWADIRLAWAYLRARSGLLALIGFFAASNFLLGVVEVLFTPLVLSFAEPHMLGLALSVGGLAMLGSSLWVSLSGGPQPRIWGVLGFNAVLGLGVMLGGLRPSIWLVMLGVSLAFISFPVIQSSAQVILQQKVAPNLQGRVFALRNMLATGTFPLAYLLAGPLADYIFEPLLAVDGVLAGSVGLLIGTGPGRGIALCFALLGGATVVLAMGGALYRPLRQIEQLLPDADPDLTEAATPERPETDAPILAPTAWQSAEG